MGSYGSLRVPVSFGELGDRVPVPATVYAMRVPVAYLRCGVMTDTLSRHRRSAEDQGFR